MAASNTRIICLYEISQRILLKQFQITQNQSLDGLFDFVDSRKLTEIAPKGLLDAMTQDEDAKDALPGVKRGDLSQRTTLPLARYAILLGILTCEDQKL